MLNNNRKKAFLFNTGHSQDYRGQTSCHGQQQVSLITLAAKGEKSIKLVAMATSARD